MTRKHTKRTIRPIDPMAMYRVTGRVTTFTEAEQAALNLPVRMALQAFIDRTAVEDDFHTLAAAANVAMICAEKIDHQVEILCNYGLDALMRVLDRQKRTGQWGLDGPARKEINDAIEVYEQLTSLLTGGQLKDAMVQVIKRMQAGEVREVAPA